MDVQLYVYDLSQGLARQFSQQFLGTHIDAVYHTAIVIDNIEYFYGAGVQTTYAGSTHHGQPMEKIRLGSTDLPFEIILEYLESLKQIYTMEAYDLFLHNCNNFSNDFAMFLVGKGIPEHITSLPRRVLETPFGQMLRPTLDRAMRPVVQAPVSHPVQTRPSANAASAKPSHPHNALKVPSLLSTAGKPVRYAKVPPLDKVIAKLGTLGKESIVSDLKRFIEAVHGKVSQEAPVPVLPALSSWLEQGLRALPDQDLFAAYDLFRLAVADARVAAYFAEEKDTVTTMRLLKHINTMGGDAPYNLRIVSLHVACNLLAFPLSSHVLLANEAIRKELITLATTSLLDEEHNNVRISAASLAFNIAATNHRRRMERGEELLSDDSQVELIASILEALGREEESKDAVKGLAIAVGLLVYCAPQAGEVLELCKAMDAGSVVQSKLALSENDPTLKEIAGQLLTDGLK